MGAEHKNTPARQLRWHPVRQGRGVVLDFSPGDGAAATAGGGCRGGWRRRSGRLAKRGIGIVGGRPRFRAFLNEKRHTPFLPNHKSNETYTPPPHEVVGSKWQSRPWLAPHSPCLLYLSTHTVTRARSSSSGCTYVKLPAKTMACLLLRDEARASDKKCTCAPRPWNRAPKRRDFPAQFSTGGHCVS